MLSTKTNNKKHKALKNKGIEHFYNVVQGCAYRYIINELLHLEFLSYWKEKIREKEAEKQNSI